MTAFPRTRDERAMAAARPPIATRATLLVFAVASVACGDPAVPRASAPIASSPTRSAARDPVRPIDLATPARYVITQDHGAVFDDEPRPPPGPTALLADGVRVLAEAGAVVGHAPSPEPLRGFRSLPARLGGGYLVWSSARTYHAASFLGPLVPVAGAGAVGGARPWLDAVLLRTERGLLTFDPRTRRTGFAGWPGVADALAVDAKRAVLVDALGRIQATSDGAGAFRDLTEPTGALARSLRIADDGSLRVTSVAGGELVLDATGGLVVPSGRSSGAPDAAEIGRQLAPETLRDAAIAGALLPGGRAVAWREGGLRILSASTGATIDDVDLPGAADAMTRCQPLWSGRELLFACAHERGAHVLRVTADAASLRLEATFPDRAGFVGGPSGRLAFTGRCGTVPPGPHDLRSGADSRGNAPEPDPEAPRYACVRASDGRWIEHRLDGADAAGLFRWIPGVPGEEGAVTALVLVDPGARRGVRAQRSGGLRVIRIARDDPALAAASLLPPRAPSDSPPYRAIDDAFWNDDDGAIRGWALARPSGADEDDATRVLTSVRIDPAGSVRVDSPLPGAKRVLAGGPFALARIERNERDGRAAREEGNDGDERVSYVESTDGGRTWREVAGPPFGGIEDPVDHADDAIACSAIGCALGGGIVRLGWGGALSAPAALSALMAPEASRSPAASWPPPLVLPSLSCRLTSALPAPARDRSDRSASAEPITLRTRGLRAIGTIASGRWSADVLLPFSPAARPRRIHLDVGSAASVGGSTAPLFPAQGTPRASAVELLLAGDGAFTRLGARGVARGALPDASQVASAVELAGGDLLVLDEGRGALVLVRGDRAHPIARLTRVPEVTRLRFALAPRLVPPGGVALAAYSASSGDVLLSAIDLARADVGPLVPAGRLDALEPGSSDACARAKARHRFVADLPLAITVHPPGGAAHRAVTSTAFVLVASTGDRLCAEAVEARTDLGDLSARFAPALAAVVRAGNGSVPATCTLARPAR